MWLSLSLVVVIFALSQSFSVAAQSGLEGLESSASYRFGQLMSFYLRGETASTSSRGQAVSVQTATLTFAASEWEQPLFIKMQVESGEELDLVWEVPFSDAPVAPFSTVVYQWELLLEDGRSLTLPQNELYYEDNQFEWQRQSADGVDVHWVSGDAALGDEVIQIVAESEARLAEYLPLSQAEGDNERLQLYIYPSSADLRAALRLTGHDWDNNHADPVWGALLVTAVNQRTAIADLSRTIPHELAHHRLYQLAGADYDTMPIWFTEGVASLAEAMPNPTYDVVLETAVSNQTHIPFPELCAELPSAAIPSTLVEAESDLLLNMIQSQYGNSAIQTLATKYAAGVACETAVVQTINKTLAELEQEWLETEQQQSPATQFLAEYGVWLLLVTFGLLFMGSLIWKL